MIDGSILTLEWRSVVLGLSDRQVLSSPGPGSRDMSRIVPRGVVTAPHGDTETGSSAERRPARALEHVEVAARSTARRSGERRTSIDPNAEPCPRARVERPAHLERR